MAPARLLLIDNYDSYTHNLSHLFAKANCLTPPLVIRADAYPTLSSLSEDLDTFDGYILSPGPGSPHNLRDFPQLERELLQERLPVFGVCLGHQALCAAYGATVAPAPAGPVHGVVSMVARAPEGQNCPLLRGLPTQFAAVRYHSLAVQEEDLQPSLIPTAWTTDTKGDGRKCKVMMAVRHRSAPLFGVQFHPESVASQFGIKLAANFLDIAKAARGCRAVPRPLTRSTYGRDVNGAGKGACQLRTIVKKAPLDSVDAASVFLTLYGAETSSFWLDSSSASKLASSVSPCWSPDPDTGSGFIEKEELVTKDGEITGFDGCDGKKERFSIMGSCNGPRSEIVTYDVRSKSVAVCQRDGSCVKMHDTTIFDYLESSLKEKYAPQPTELPVEMNGGYVGYLGYELKADTDPVVGNNHQSDLPDAWLLFADRFVVIDHHEESMYLVAVVGQSRQEEEDTYRWFSKVTLQLGTGLQNCHLSSIHQTPVNASPRRRKPLLFEPERRRSAYIKDIQECLREIKSGESYEVCLTNRLRTRLPVNCEKDPLDIYLALRLVNPAPYSAFLRLHGNVAVCCSSPERYLRISSDLRVESKPIKGTLPRGRSLEEDESLRLQLENSPKDRSENLMIVDLVRNDLSRTCAVGSVHVPKLMKVESYATVHQLVSTVTGVLEDSASPVSCIRSAYPMGSMTGAPKVRTMEIIDRLERSSRGIYSGSIGYLSINGAADLNVVIRTAILNEQDVEIGVGGAIVALSNPEDEYDEVILKGKAIMQTLALSATGRSDYIVLHEGIDDSVLISKGLEKCNEEVLVSSVCS